MTAIVLAVASIAVVAALIYWLVTRGRPDFVTKHGIKVWTDGHNVTAEMVERHTDTAMSEAENVNVFSGLRIFILPPHPFDSLQADGTYQLAWGDYAESIRRIRLAYTYNLNAMRPGGEPVLVHELRHDRCRCNFHS